MVTICHFENSETGTVVVHGDLKVSFGNRYGHCLSAFFAEEMFVLCFSSTLVGVSKTGEVCWEVKESERIGGASNPWVGMRVLELDGGSIIRVGTFGGNVYQIVDIKCGKLQYIGVFR